MLFEIRKIPVHSIKEFSKEYLMIVVGILTALGLEHLIANQHHARAAEQARQQIVAELRANLQEVRDAERENTERLAPLVTLAASLKQEILAGQSKAAIYRRTLAQARGHLDMGYALPTLRHEAWDVAVANQSATDIDPAALRRYSAAYASQRDNATLAIQGGMALLDSPQVLDAMTDLDLGRADPLTFLKVLGHMTATLKVVQTNLVQLQAQLEKTLAGESKDATVSAEGQGH